jgi:hypothetical protein
MKRWLLLLFRLFASHAVHILPLPLSRFVGFLTVFFDQH